MPGAAFCLAGDPFAQSERREPGSADEAKPGHLLSQHGGTHPSTDGAIHVTFSSMVQKGGLRKAAAIWFLPLPANERWGTRGWFPNGVDRKGGGVKSFVGRSYALLSLSGARSRGFGRCVLRIAFPCQVKVRQATWADQNLGQIRGPHFFLKDRLDTILIAVCAKIMCWFGGVHNWLQSIRQRPSVPDLLEFVLLSLGVPCFKVSHFFFKLTFMLQQRKLVLLGRHCARLGGDDYSLQFNDLVLNKGEITETYQCLRDVASRL